MTSDQLKSTSKHAIDALSEPGPFFPLALRDSAAFGRQLVVLAAATFGAIHQAVKRARAEGLDVSHIQVRYICPLPRNLGELLNSFDAVLVPEMNTGQFVRLIRAEYLIDAEALNKVAGQPFKIGEILAAIHKKNSELEAKL